VLPNLVVLTVVSGEILRFRDFVNVLAALDAMETSRDAAEPLNSVQTASADPGPAPRVVRGCAAPGTCVSPQKPRAA
jgi:hypothetical protein